MGRNNSYLDKITVCRFPALTRRPKTSLLVHTTCCSSILGRYEPAVLHDYRVAFDHWWGALLTYVEGIKRQGHDPDSTERARNA